MFRITGSPRHAAPPLRRQKPLNPTDIPAPPLADWVESTNHDIVAKLLFGFMICADYDWLGEVLADADGTAHKYEESDYFMHYLATPYSFENCYNLSFEGITLLQFAMLTVNWYSLNILVGIWPKKEEMQVQLYNQICDFDKIEENVRRQFDYSSLLTAYKDLIALLQNPVTPTQEEIQVKWLALGAAQKNVPVNFFFYLVRRVISTLPQPAESAEMFHNRLSLHPVYSHHVKAKYRAAYVKRDDAAQWVNESLPATGDAVLQEHLTVFELALAKEVFFNFTFGESGMAKQKREEISNTLRDKLGLTGALLFSVTDQGPGSFSEKIILSDLEQIKADLTAVMAFLNLWEMRFRELQEWRTKMWKEKLNPVRQKEATGNNPNVTGTGSDPSAADAASGVENGSYHTPSPAFF